MLQWEGPMKLSRSSACKILVKQARSVINKVKKLLNVSIQIYLKCIRAICAESSAPLQSMTINQAINNTVQ